MPVSPQCSVTADLGHSSSGFWKSFSPATEGPLKISPLFPNGLSHRSRREAGRGRESRGLFAVFPKALPLQYARRDFLRKHTVKCVLLNEATVQLSQLLLLALHRVVHSWHQHVSYLQSSSASLRVAFLYPHNLLICLFVDLSSSLSLLKQSRCQNQILIKNLNDKWPLPCESPSPMTHSEHFPPQCTHQKHSVVVVTVLTLR